MARTKLSEYRAKSLLYAALAQTQPGHGANAGYTGLAVDTSDPDWRAHIKTLPQTQRYVVKVDQGVKGRFKKGLVILDRTLLQVPEAIQAMAKKGYHYFLVEPYQPHATTSEVYLSLSRDRAGLTVTYSRLGGIDIESHPDSLERSNLGPTTALKLKKAIGLSPAHFHALVTLFDDAHLSLLEINPLVIDKPARSTVGSSAHATPRFLDAAVLVDAEAEPFVGGAWTAADFRTTAAKTPQEATIAQLADQSQASFRLEVLNPNGQVFLLLSGGGASVVLADEVYNQGFGAALANYGEYSGNPNAEETYIYTREVLSLLLASTAKSKVLIIGGGVANFTDIRATFTGVIRALDQVKDQLTRQHVRVFVRRGGPHEAAGLAHMRQFLSRAGLLGAVTGPDLPLSDIVPQALATLTLQKPTNKA